MIAALQVCESFTHADFTLLENASRRLAAEFVGNGEKSEFFYYLKPTDKMRWYFIRIQTTDKDKFVQAVESFSRTLGFRVLPKRETQELIFRIDLEDFV